MSPESFNEHDLFNKLNLFEEILSNDEIKEKIDLENLTFFGAVCSHIKKHIKLIDPYLIKDSELDSLSNELNQGISFINKFVSDANSAHLLNANNQLNAVINRLNKLPIIIGNVDYDFSLKVSEFRKTVADKYKSLAKETQDLKSEIEQAKTDLNYNKEEIQKLSKLIEEKEIKIENLNSDFKTNFDNILSTHNQTFENNQKTYRNEIDSEKENFRDDINELKDKLSNDSDEIIDQLTSKLEEAKKLIGIIGNVGITGNYQNIANDHKKNADILRIIAMLFMSAFSGLLIWIIFDLNSEAFEWSKSLIRIIAALALSYPAAYAALESSKHRKLEIINRKAELELASINPFIEELPDDKKQTIKQELVEKYFGKNNDSVFQDAKEVEWLSISALEKLVKLLKNFNGKQ